MRLWNWNFINSYLETLLTIHRNDPPTRQTWTIRLIIWLTFLHCVIFICVNNRMLLPLSDQSYLLVDKYLYRHRIIPNFYFYSILISLNLMSAYYYHVAYFRLARYVFFYIMYDMFIGKEDKYLLESNVAHRPIKEILNYCWQAMVIGRRFLFFVQISFFCSSQYSILRTALIYSDYYLYTGAGLLETLTIELLSILFFIDVYALIHVSNIVLIATVTISIVYLTRLDQIGQLLVKNKSSVSQWLIYRLRLARFMKLHTESVVTIERSNQFFSKAFGVFMLISSPICAIFIVTLMIGNLNKLDRILILVVVLSFGCCIFFTHLMLTMYPKRIHRPIKQLIPATMSRPIRLSNFANQFKISHYFEKFHTENQYGITYGTYGLVTTYSFMNFALFFTQNLMFIMQVFEHKLH